MIAHMTLKGPDVVMRIHMPRILVEVVINAIAESASVTSVGVNVALMRPLVEHRIENLAATLERIVHGHMHADHVLLHVVFAL